jgi:hypothetical protein
MTNLCDRESDSLLRFKSVSLWNSKAIAILRRKGARMGEILFGSKQAVNLNDSQSPIGSSQW